jgi:hypothetical protein
MHHALVTFCAWLELTPFSRALQNIEWIIPAVQTVHILAVAAVMASALMLDLRVLGVRGTGQSLARVAAQFLPVIWTALPVLLATGVVMISAEPARALQNPAFQLKMLLLVAALLVTLGFQRPLRRRSDFWELSRRRRRAASSLAALSLALWVAILFAGRWIAYMVVR